MGRSVEKESQTAKFPFMLCLNVLVMSCSLCSFNIEEEEVSLEELEEEFDILEV